MSEDPKQTPPDVPFEEDEYVQFARERMATRPSIKRIYSKRNPTRSSLFTIFIVVIFIIMYNLIFKASPPPTPVPNSPSIVIGGKKFVPLDTFHLAPNVNVSPSGK